VKKLVLNLLNLCLGLFLADAVVSLLDDSLILLIGPHPLSAIRWILSTLTLLVAILVYCLMGLTPMIPKRAFLPVTLFNPLGVLAAIPFSIYYYNRIDLVSWGISLCQVVFGLGILYWLTGGLKFRWPWVVETRLDTRGFSWLNLSVFLLVNVFGLLPAVCLYLVVCCSLAVDHFSGGFLALHARGLTVRVRQYVRNDGKTIRLIPMAHVGEPDFYRKLSQSFPSNSIILMEGVSDEKHLLTNGISYKRAATSLGLAEQEREFAPTQGEIVLADVDVNQFSTNTIDILNLVMLVHSKGLNAEVLLKLIQLSPDPGVQAQLYEDLLSLRNRRLVEEIQARLPQTENIMVPWGVAHMPGIAREIQKSGFRLNDSQEYEVIRFGSRPKQK
jgi:hypothetical protein